ncbi:MAG: hypothetical protein ACK5NK_03080, partial [Niabella sp.]
ANLFAGSLQKRYQHYIIGPSEPVVNRVRGMYLMEILLKLPPQLKLINQCKIDILNQTAILHQEKRYRSVVIIPDVDAI